MNRRGFLKRFLTLAALSICLLNSLLGATAIVRLSDIVPDYMPAYGYREFGRLVFE